MIYSSRPVLIFDGDCHFCRFWVERWRGITAGRVDYRPFQDAAGDYPQIARSEFENAVQLIEPDGRVTQGADAVLRALEFSSGPARWLGPALAWIPFGLLAARAAYRFIARNRAHLGWVAWKSWRQGCGCDPDWR